MVHTAGRDSYVVYRLVSPAKITAQGEIGHSSLLVGNRHLFSLPDTGR